MCKNILKQIASNKCLFFIFLMIMQHVPLILSNNIPDISYIQVTYNFILLIEINFKLKSYNIYKFDLNLLIGALGYG